MKSAKPKVLHSLAGKPLLHHVLTAVKDLQPAKVVVICGHEADQLKASFTNFDVVWVHQKEQLGTGHAVAQAFSHIDPSDRVLVLLGDVPLISSATLSDFLTKTKNYQVGLLTAQVENPTGLGRILRDATGEVLGIVEERDANEQQLTLNEINTGIITAQAGPLQGWLAQLKNHNAQGEYYLTDIVAMATTENNGVKALRVPDPLEITGVNTRSQLAHLERAYQQRKAELLMEQGATLFDPARLDIRGEVQVGQDVTIDVNVILVGKVFIDDGCVIGANTILRDCRLGPNVKIKPHTLVDGADISEGCTIGPFARIRPGSMLSPSAQVGNFVELKKAQVGEGTKINHLSYIGDATIGTGTNIGAGTITCNYDGVKKHQTVIGNNAFIGSGTQLVAPINIGENATIAAGATVFKDAPAQQLTRNKKEQEVLKGWHRPESPDASITSEPEE